MKRAMAIRHFHGRELRVIGQQLDKLDVDIFELRHADGDYSIECADPNPPYLDLIKLRYSAFEVRSLDLNAAAGRRDSFTLVNFQSLAECLRAAGRYLERIEATLLRISVSDTVASANIWRIEYESRDGEYHSEEKPLSGLADLAMHMYKDRSRGRPSVPERNSLFR